MANNIYFEKLELEDTFKEWRDKINNLITNLSSATSIDNISITRNEAEELQATDIILANGGKASEYGQIGDTIYKNSTTDLNTLTETGVYACDTAQGIDYNHPMTMPSSSAIVTVKKRGTVIYQDWREMRSALFFSRYSNNSGESWGAWQPIGGQYSAGFKIYISKSGNDTNTGLDNAHPVLTIQRALAIAHKICPSNAGASVAFCIGEGNWGDVTLSNLPYVLYIYPFTGVAATSYSSSLPVFGTLSFLGAGYYITRGIVADIVDANAGAFVDISNSISRFGQLRSRYDSAIDVYNSTLEVKSNGTPYDCFRTYHGGKIIVGNASTCKVIENITVDTAFIFTSSCSKIMNLEAITFSTENNVTVTGKKYSITSGSSVSYCSKEFLDSLPGTSDGIISSYAVVEGIPYGGGATNEALIADLSWKPVILQSGGNLTGNLNLYFEDDYYGRLCALNDTNGKRIILDTYEDGDYGAYLCLYKYSSESIKGGFILGARNADGSVTKNLVGVPEGGLSWDGSFTASTVYNAVWNDYAEFFPRGEETEPGDIIALDSNSEKEQYVKATKDSYLIVGAHSNTYAHLIGGEVPPEGEDFITYNLPKFIPVGLAGRINIKFKGKSKKGYPVTISDIPGVAELYSGSGHIIGYIVEDKDSNSEEIRLVKILIRHN